MNLDTFRSLASSASLIVCVSGAKPYGGWEEPRSLEMTLDYLEEDAEDCGEDLDEMIEEMLSMSVVVACDSGGRVVGAWSAAGWFLGNRAVTIDEAYGRVVAG